MEKDSALFSLIPTGTIHAARALYGQGNLYLQLGDRLNHLASKFDSGTNSDYLRREKTALLALLTIIQYAEKMTDGELTEAVQQRVELRYALHLPTPSHRIDPYFLCQFRSRVLADPQYHRLFEEMFNHICPEITVTTQKEEPEVDDVVNLICELEIDASLSEAMLRAMEALSANHFTWLRGIAFPHWYQRYNHSFKDPITGRSFQKQELRREEMLEDIERLLTKIQESNSDNILEMNETKTLDLIRERFSNPKPMKNCDRCLHQVHQKEVQINDLFE